MSTATMERAEAQATPVPPAPQRPAPQQAPPVSPPPAQATAQAAPLPPPPFVIRSAKPPAGAAPPPIKALIYGAYGSGKTWFGGSAVDVPAMRDILFIDAESGVMTLNDREDVDVVSIKTYRELDGIKEYLIRHCAARDKKDLATLTALEARLKPGETITKPKQYRTVIIDSISELYRLLMYDLLGVHPGETNLDVQMDSPEWAHYGQAAQRIQLMIRTFREIPVNVIFIASSQDKKDNDATPTRSIPNVSGKLAKDIQGFLDCVGFLRSAANDKGEIIRRLDIAGTSQFDAKHRFTHAKVNFLMNPTMQDFFNLAHNLEGNK